MAVAWVGDGGNGRFGAYVDYSEPRPWSYTHGPRAVPLEEALAWARARANQVIVTVGDVRYTAGAEPVEIFAPWPEAATEVSRVPASGPSVVWGVKARTGWRRADREAVARRLAEFVGRDGRVSGAAASLDEFGFAITFRLSACSELDANEAASSVMRDAWTGSHIDAVPGTDFDVDSLVVELV